MYCRFHTFGIGSEVCIELVMGIATISGGRCVLLKEGERLQSKVSVLSWNFTKSGISNIMIIECLSGLCHD